jgi:hypothetical protein
MTRIPVHKDPGIGSVANLEWKLGAGYDVGSRIKTYILDMPPSSVTGDIIQEQQRLDKFVEFLKRR